MSIKTKSRHCKLSILRKVMLVMAILVLAFMVYALISIRTGSRRGRIYPTRYTIAFIEQAARTYEIRTGKFPDSLDVLIQPMGDRPALLEKNVLFDFWGNPISYILTNETFVLRSSGTDGVMYTADDLLNQ